MNGSFSVALVAQMAIAQFCSFASLLLLASAVHKLRGWARAQHAVHELTGLPKGLAGMAAIGIAAAELASGLGLWVPAVRLDAALLASLVWAGYLVFLLRAVMSGRRDLDCGCSFSSAHRPLGAFHVTRAAVLTGLSLLVALSAAVAPGAVPYDLSAAAVLTELLAGIALLVLYAALDQVMAVQPLRAGIQA
ncbi:MAG: MauE/DoxX family redox-associated membrane protein [Steroidobacterales bacterium]